MDNFVVGDDAEVVCVGEIDDIEIVELVTVLGREALKIFDDYYCTIPYPTGNNLIDPLAVFKGN